MVTAQHMRGLPTLLHGACIESQYHNIAPFGYLQISNKA